VEHVPRTSAPLHATGAVQFLPLPAVSADATFRLRAEGDLSALAASIARLGQLAPVEVRPLPGAGDGPVRWQLVAGFRRVAAMRLLGRQRVLARVHDRLDEEDAWGLALCQALLGEPLSLPELGGLRDRLERERLAPWAAELVDEALARAPVAPELRARFLEFLERGGDAPAGGADEDQASAAAAEEAPAVPAPDEPAPGERPPDEPEEVTPEALAEALATGLWELNQDLALAWDAWADLPPEGRRQILEQARFVAELYPLLRGGRR
jgi:hypothetical protein